MVEVLVMAGAADLWVFGYGSLMWRPDFAFTERHQARLDGYHRCFCITSTHHRGSADRPGLVLGLDRGGTCQGVVYRVAAAHAADVSQYLRKRELVNGVYREAMLPVAIGGADRTEIVSARSYIVERAHPSYAGPMSLNAQSHMIRGARGLSGNNLDYLVNTVRQLQAMGIRERDLERILALAAPHLAAMSALGPSGALTHPVAAGLRRVVARTPFGVKCRVRAMRPGERRRFLYRMRLGG